MTKEQINRLAQLLTDTAETAANIELQALAAYVIADRTAVEPPEAY